MGFIGFDLQNVIKRISESISEANSLEKAYSFNLVIGDVNIIKREITNGLLKGFVNSDFRVREVHPSQINKEYVASLSALKSNQSGVILIPDYRPNDIYYQLLIKIMFNVESQQRTGWNVILISSHPASEEWQKDSAFDYFCMEKGMNAFVII